MILKCTCGPKNPVFLPDRLIDFNILDLFQNKNLKLNYRKIQHASFLEFAIISILSLKILL